MTLLLYSSRFLSRCVLYTAYVKPYFLVRPMDRWHEDEWKKGPVKIRLYNSNGKQKRFILSLTGLFSEATLGLVDIAGMSIVSHPMCDIFCLEVDRVFKDRLVHSHVDHRNPWKGWRLSCANNSVGGLRHWDSGCSSRSHLGPDTRHWENGDKPRSTLQDKE